MTAASNLPSTDTVTQQPFNASVEQEYERWDKAHEQMTHEPPGHHYIQHAVNLLDLLKPISEIYPIAKVVVGCFEQRVLFEKDRHENDGRVASVILAQAGMMRVLLHINDFTARPNNPSTLQAMIELPQLLNQVQEKIRVCHNTIDIYYKQHRMSKLHKAREWKEKMLEFVGAFAKHRLLLYQALSLQVASDVSDPIVQRNDEHHNRNLNHGIAFIGNHLAIAGGSFTTIHNVHSSLPVFSHQQQVLDILYPTTGPPRIDGRLLHNSSEYENARLRAAQHIPDNFQLSKEVIDRLPKRGALQQNSSHYVRERSSKHISIPVAEHLACNGNLLATIILPDSTPPCTKFIVATLAYQVVKNIPSSAEYMLAALRGDPGIFERNTETQFNELIKIPLEKAHMNAPIVEKDNWPNAIVLDGNAQKLAPGSVVHWILESFSALPVNTVTHMEVQAQDTDLAPRPGSLAQSFWNILTLALCRLLP